MTTTNDPNVAPDGGRRLTGRHVLLIAVAFFGVIIAVNLYMASVAVEGFSGLVVKNSYVASQGWDADRKKQMEQGWKVSVSTAGNGMAARFEDRDGRALDGLIVTAVIGRPANENQDRTVTLSPRAGEPGVYALAEPLGKGVWRAALTAVAADGGTHHAVAELHIK